VTWLLFMVVLQINQSDAWVKHAEIIQTLHSEKSCIREMKKIFADAKEQGNEVPKMVNFGCVPLKGRSI
jgi:hypothetical protein